ncbi:FAD/NAD(P)-binding oxidoreductase family protein [Wolffia australiana]
MNQRGEEPVHQEPLASRPKAIVVGGSIAGLSVAHALLSAKWEVIVIEKTARPPSGNPTGAGLGLDQQSQQLLSSWISPDFIEQQTLPLSIDLNRGIDSEKKTSRTLSRDDDFGFRAAYWADLFSSLLGALPAENILWAHHFLRCHPSDGTSTVKIDARCLRTGVTLEISGDLLVAADGCLSSVRRQFLPNFKLRYSGYTAWRGVLDLLGQENSETVLALRRSYKELGNCLYFDLASKTHCVLYELKNRKINWIWYLNQPEPKLEGNSVTMKTSSDMIKKMHDDADITWLPELARIMKETKEPFINVIYDSDPLPRLFWGNVVLVGDAAHPTSPHCLRSTNMSILDAGALARCLEIWGLENLPSALEQYQSIRLPVVSKQVLHARRLGRTKQGLPLPDGACFDPAMDAPDLCRNLLQRQIPFFDSAPLPGNLAVP